MFREDKWIVHQLLLFVLLRINPICCKAKWILKNSHLAQFPCVLKRTFYNVILCACGYDEHHNGDKNLQNFSLLHFCKSWIEQTRCYIACFMNRKEWITSLTKRDKSYYKTKLCSEMSMFNWVDIDILRIFIDI